MSAFGVSLFSVSHSKRIKQLPGKVLLKCGTTKTERSSSQGDGWMGHTLDFPSEDQGSCPVCDQDSREICFWCYVSMLKRHKLRLYLFYLSDILKLLSTASHVTHSATWLPIAPSEILVCYACSGWCSFKLLALEQLRMFGKFTSFQLQTPRFV